MEIIKKDELPPELLEKIEKTARKSTEVEIAVLKFLQENYPEESVHSVAMPLLTIAIMLLARGGFTPKQTLHFMESSFTAASMRIAMEAQNSES